MNMNMDKDNITLGDYIFAKTIGRNYLIYLIYVYPKLIKYLINILKKIKIMNMIKLILRSSINYDNCLIKSPSDIMNCIDLLGQVFNIRIGKDIISLEYKGRELRFIYGEPIRDIILSLIEQFRLEQYSLAKSMGLKDIDVIDVGAYIGDSAIWFSINGARHVYAIEPFPYVFRMAETNIKLNNIGNVTLINAGIGNMRTKVKILNTISGRYDSILRESIDGIDIPILTLEDLVNTYGIEDALLKMDCEGCEKSILYTSIETLRRFKYIIIEYDHGYLDLMNMLKRAGFTVKKRKRPHIAGDRITGMLYAIAAMRP